MPGTHASLYPMSKPDQGIICLKGKKGKQITSQFFLNKPARDRKKKPLKKIIKEKKKWCKGVIINEKKKKQKHKNSESFIIIL